MGGGGGGISLPSAPKIETPFGDGGGGLGKVGIPGLGGGKGGAGIPNILGGTPGILGGLPGFANGGILNNTPFDPGTWTAEQMGGGVLADWGEKLGGIFGGGGKKEKSTIGDNIPMPTMSGYTGIDTLGGKGVLGASTVDASPWMNMALDRQAADQARMFDSAIKNQQSALAQGRNSLAMRGGLSSGASERMAMQGANDLASARQDILSQGASERANLGMQNAQLQTDIGKFNAGQTQGANQFNVAQSIQDLARRNEQDRFKYGEEMKLKGAGMSAQAMANSGKK